MPHSMVRMRWVSLAVVVISVVVLSAILALTEKSESAVAVADWKPFEMTYTKEVMEKGEVVSSTTWRLSYRASDDWEKVVVSATDSRDIGERHTSKGPVLTISHPLIRPDREVPTDGDKPLMPELWLFVRDWDRDPVAAEVESPELGTVHYVRTSVLDDGRWEDHYVLDARTRLPRFVEYQRDGEVVQRVTVQELRSQ